MKLRATTGFDFHSSLEPEAVIKRMREILADFRTSHPDVIEATAVTTEPFVITVDLVLMPMSYGEAEALVLALGNCVIAYLEECDSTEIEEREIELLPA